ncbi:Possible lysine decarboxylase [Devosia crocina]|uniref:Possible lysine decarboxylase n=1 Tax=Devosia crocina TaxID=429728 RepID=A0A1I7NMX6_9HYPH|nr:LOG family protein [Devosia crocina]SFV36007.1 Possible lysine decarboxylase [Devosia crocina]
MNTAEISKTSPVIGIFASDRGPGDPERASLMSQTGTLLARRGAQVLCLWEAGVAPLPLMAAARQVGGSVSILADEDIVLPPTLAGVPVRVIPDRAARHETMSAEAEVFVALPGSLGSATALFGSWAAGKGKGRPVVMLNRHKAFEVVKGFAGDVLSHAISGHDKRVQFADGVEDLWNKIGWVLEQRR